MTQEEIIRAITDDKTMPFIQPEQLAGIVDFVIKNYQPSLPSNLDEAAHKYADGENPTCPCEECLIKTFKAGAEWIARQGITVEGDIEGNWRNQEDAPYEIYVTSDCLPKDTEFKFGDKVVVQIRKK